MLYSTGEERTKEDYKILLQEIQAYANLDGQGFDFGNGFIENNGKFHYGSEDAYLKMAEDIVKEILEYWNYENYLAYNDKNKKHEKIRLNKYERKKIDQNKYKELSTRSWISVNYHEDENYYERCYVSGRRKYAKYCTNRKVRHTNDFKLKCAGYRKVHDYWCDVW